MKRFLINLLAVMVITFGANEAFGADIKFVQIADSHYAVNNEYSQDVLKETVKQVNKLKGVSFVVFTGDNINRPREEDLISFVRTANKLKAPYYLVFGDHDVYKNGGMSKINYIETVKDNHFFYRPSSPNYVIKKQGFVFIDKQLSKNKKTPVIILQHYPIVEPKERKSHRVYQPEKYFEILEKHNNVIAIVSGHYHINGEQMKDGIYHISTPSLLIPPNYYKVIDIVTTPGFSPMIYTELKSVNVK